MVGTNRWEDWWSWHRIFNRIWIEFYGIFNWPGLNFNIFSTFLREKSRKNAAASKKGFWTPKWPQKWGPREVLGAHFETKICQKMEKSPLKKSLKTQPFQKSIFCCNLAFLEGKTLNFKAFWDAFESPGASFSDVFLGCRFCLNCGAFLVKKLIKAKTRQVAFVS